MLTRDIEDFQIIKFFGDKLESVRYQRKYVMVRIFDRNTKLYEIISTWCTYDSSTGLCFLDDNMALEEMVKNESIDLYSYLNSIITERIYVDINSYTREILDYVNNTTE